MLNRIWQANLNQTGPIWSWFDPDNYAKWDALAAQAMRNGPEAALADFQQRGVLLGYAPNRFFDTQYYLHANPQVRTAIDKGRFRSAFDHYCAVGWQNWSAHWLFDLTCYQSRCPDVSTEILAGTGGFYAHFLQYGISEKRQGHRLFDAAFYLKQITSEQARSEVSHPFGHFLASIEMLSTESQCSLYFNPRWYLDTYPDVKAAILAGDYVCALHHYIIAGTRQMRDPLCDFSESDYRLSNPDVDRAIAAGSFKNSYDHFLQFGAKNHRSPSRHLDLDWYARQKRVACDLATGKFDHAFQHFLEVGLVQGFPLRAPVAADFALNEEEARSAFLSQARRALPGFGRHPLNFSFAGMPDVSVIVVLRNQFPLTMQALASLRQTYLGALQLIMVDNASSDETRNITDVVWGAELIRLPTNIGFVEACNLALSRATASYALYLNHDVVLQPLAVEHARARLARDTTTGAVGGKIIRTHGLLQEAGCILWRDGSTTGWMRDAPPDAAEANYVRDVDFCSRAFLMVKTDLLRQLGGFDPTFGPASFEDIDLCLRIQQAGFRIVYDPAVALIHYECVSSRNARGAISQILTNRAKLWRLHAATLRRRVGEHSRSAEAAGFASRGRRVLLIEDTVPIHRLGSGYGRSADILRELVAAGWQATVFPMQPVVTPLFQLTKDLPETVEILWDRNRTMLEAFLKERQGYYDLIWISRAHNLRQLQKVIGLANDVIRSPRIILDTEAVFSVREATRAELDGLPFNLKRALARELDGSWMCDHVVATNKAEADILSSFPLASVGVIGTCNSHQVTTRSWSERQGILHVGALWAEDSPNYDGLRWYLEHVQPELERLIGLDSARLTIAGYVSDNVDMSWLYQNPSVEILGPVADLAPLFDRHRVFVAPTRYAAGVAFKLVDAVAFGLPITCTTLLAQQLGWTNGVEVLHTSHHDPGKFAENIATIYQGKALWESLRRRGLEAAATDFNAAQFAQQVAKAVVAAGLQTPTYQELGCNSTCDTVEGIASLTPSRPFTASTDSPMRAESVKSPAIVNLAVSIRRQRGNP